MSASKGGRSAYHHGDLRNALVEAATELARGDGPEAVVLREAARRVGVSATAAYRHFANQADLLQAVKVRGQRELADSMQRGVEAAPGGGDKQQAARDRLWQIGRGYVRFALAEPGLYRAAFCRVPHVSDHPWDEGQPDAAEHGEEYRSFDMLVETLDGMEAAGVMRPGVREGAEFAAWSAVHGLVMLILDGPLSRLPEPVRDAVIDRTIGTVVAGLTREPVRS
ncbi:TetR/AcrR family transcriptional regulator [Streptomyces sp. A7024]|uniref:TetR/AcrR family transcriptional regulator n=1 Tax=Streptomyces coryli TaxID=1128680 RepID=A0A6G4TTQ7_9ACTN|nr:TetR/AcrR family transcriptional regulator [Streptomyces coryli]NGN62407.1 TetR/AcrR family transcriptional regulator [Streptomyces coryli]